MEALELHIDPPKLNWEYNKSFICVVGDKIVTLGDLFQITMSSSLSFSGM